MRGLLSSGCGVDVHVHRTPMRAIRKQRSLCVRVEWRACELTLRPPMKFRDEFCPAGRFNPALFTHHGLRKNNGTAAEFS